MLNVIVLLTLVTLAVLMAWWGALASRAKNRTLTDATKLPRSIGRGACTISSSVDRSCPYLGGGRLHSIAKRR
jgi:hypothetical protein